MTGGSKAAPPAHDPRLAHGGVRKSDDGETGESRRDVDLHGDRTAVDPVKCGGRNGGEHDRSPLGSARAQGHGLLRWEDQFYKTPVARDAGGNLRQGCISG